MRLSAQRRDLRVPRKASDNACIPNKPMAFLLARFTYGFIKCKSDQHGPKNTCRLSWYLCIEIFTSFRHSKLTPHLVDDRFACSDLAIFFGVNRIVNNVHKLMKYCPADVERTFGQSIANQPIEIIKINHQNVGGRFCL